VSRARLTLYLGEDRHKVGPGKVRLLEAVRDEGSISAAARSMGMAYRHAWMLLDELNACFAEPVVEASVGGRAGGGARITPWGEELIRLFHAMEAATRKAVRRDLAALDRHLVSSRGRRRRGAG
jgi:molybdate transport system regulatory protein